MIEYRHGIVDKIVAGVLNGWPGRFSRAPIIMRDDQVIGRVARSDIEFGTPLNWDLLS